MQKRIVVLVTLALLAGFTAGAQRKGAPPADGPKPPEAKEAQKSEKPVELTMTPGLFSIAQHEKDWYFEIPDGILGRRILAVTRFVSNTVDAGQYGGEEVNEVMIYWEKAPNGNLLLRTDVLSITADEDQIISKAVKISSENPIVASFKPEKNGTAGTTRIKVTQLFEGDTQIFSLPSRAKKQYNLGGPKSDACFINSIRTYPINTEVTVTKTFSYNAPQAGPAAGGGASRNLPAGREAGTVTIVLNTSMVLLPETPMQPRLFDPRVGYFADGYQKFSDEQQQVEQVRFITRWRLEARPEDVEKQKRGELVEPVKPIV